MPLLYLAKVNLNSSIFDVYDKKLSIENVSKLIYEKFSDGTEYTKEENGRYLDSYSNPVTYIKNSRYTFNEICKMEDGIVTGKLVRTFKKPTEKLNPVTNKMEMTFNDESVSIPFYYDVNKERLTFCERQSFGYNQFMNAFSKLLNRCVEKYEFEIFLQKDKDRLDEKLSNLRVVQKVRATLIPPNSNEDDLQELRRELNYMQQCEEANANKINLEYASENMNMEAKIMHDIKTAVSRGYGDMTATGINVNNRMQTISSSQDAAYTANIQENIGKEEFYEESRTLIIRFMAKLVNKFL